ncbi:30S ribosomal protein S13 [Candidatus Woesearchaeota archaeon]|nr:30S ribosomal protein S13 [Candidatus Woesearchaeota archaeon]
MEQAQTEQQFKHIVRIANTDLDGNRKVSDAIRKIKGIGFSFANAICQLAQINGDKKAGNLIPEEVKRIDETIANAGKTIPVWMLNRRKDLEDGTDKHLIGAGLTFAQESDIRFMKQIRSYKGVRHAMGAPVRGQRTRSNFRRNKGKVIGVIKKKEAAAAAPAKEEKGGKEKKEKK